MRRDVLGYAVLLLVAAATIVATAPTDRAQGWASPIVLGLLAVAGLCLFVAVRGERAVLQAARFVRSVAGTVSHYLPRVGVRVSWQSPERKLWKGRIVRFDRAPFFVKRAIYGSPTKHIDVGGRLNDLVSGNRLDFTVDNETMGEDPHSGTKKTLSIEYVSEGKTYSAEFDEGTRVVLP